MLPALVWSYNLSHPYNSSSAFTIILMQYEYLRYIDVVSDLMKNLTAFFRSSHPQVFLEKGVPKICSRFTGEHPCQSVISIKLQSNFIEITPRHGCSPVNLLHILRTPFPKNTSEWLVLIFTHCSA